MSLHLHGLIRISADIAISSVVLVSVIWVIVLSRIEQSDVTCKPNPSIRLLIAHKLTGAFPGNYVDAGIWSALEPNMAVICACIPSLRPLASVAGKGFANAPLVARSTARSPSGASSSRRIWESGKSSRPSDGAFSQLGDETDDLRPLGHDVSVRAGPVDEDQAVAESLEMPEQGIAVRTEVILSTSDRLLYNDRLF